MNKEQETEEKKIVSESLPEPVEEIFGLLVSTEF